MTAGIVLPPKMLATMVEDARRRTLELIQDLSDEQLTVTMKEVVNPFCWELGHVAFFYDVFLLRELGTSAFHLEGAQDLYDSFAVEHDCRWGLPLPNRAQTLSYMSTVQDAVLSSLEHSDSDPVSTRLHLLSILHEDMHCEAFTHMRQTLMYSAPSLSECAGFDPGALPGGGALPGDADIPGGTHALGSQGGEPFVFDNEKWAHPVEIAPFRISRAPITNAKFAEFVEARGYLDRRHWSTQGWIWRTQAGALQPHCWCKSRDGWQRRSFDQMVPLVEHQPVMHVNWYEAEAYCNWAGRRLPTEAEWDLAASGTPGAQGGLSGDRRHYPWGQAEPGPDRANLDGRHSGCVEVGAFPEGDSAFGCRQMIGNVWEWTSDAFYPFPGYVVDPPYREYSAPWFGDRKVLKGGCWATTSRLINNRYRNFYQPARNDIFAGFRTCALA